MVFRIVTNCKASPCTWLGEAKGVILWVEVFTWHWYNNTNSHIHNCKASPTDLTQPLRCKARLAVVNCKRAPAKRPSSILEAATSC